MRIHTVFLLMTLILIPEGMTVLSCAASNPLRSTTQISLNPTTTVDQVYQPPKRGIPGRREGAGTR